MKRRLLCIILIITMMVCALPFNVQAALNNGIVINPDAWESLFPSNPTPLPQPQPEPVVGKFIDVKKTDWFYKNVKYVYDKGLMAGITETEFQPNTPTSRAMLVTVLWRIAGKPEAVGNDFTDVKDGKWYTTAITWASRNGITSGYGDGTFGTNDNVTREQMVSFFHRFAKYASCYVGEKGDLEQFDDYDFISKYARASLSWAVGAGLLYGKTETTVDPKGNATRAEIAALIQRYEEKIAVNKIDNGVDYADNTVSEGDSYTLSSNIYDVAAGTKTAVTFFVDTTLTIPYFELMLSDKATGVKLYDDGNYEKHGDDIPGDGRYSGKYTVDTNNEGTITFNAIGTVGKTKIKTGSIGIYSYKPLSNAQLSSFKNIDSEINKLYNSAVEGVDKSSAAAVVSASQKKIGPYLESLVKSGVIKNLVYYKQGFMYTWEYTDSGVKGGKIIYDDGGYTKSSGAPYTASLKGNSSDVGNVAVLSSFDKDDCTYNEMASDLKDAGFNVNVTYNVGVATFKNLAQYDTLILVDSHGQYYTDASGVSMPVICSQTATDALRKSFSADLKDKRIYDVQLTNGTNAFWIAPKFFDVHYSNTKLNDPIVHLGLCRGRVDNNMVDSWVGAGASSAIAYDASVSFSYDEALATDIVEQLINGMTVQKALDHAKQEVGAQDWHRDAELAKNAVAQIFGNGEDKLYGGLVNGNFDKASHHVGWKGLGDVRVIRKLAGIAPRSASNMAIISSGFGSLNNQTTSSISQTFVVPANASSISFDYNVVSEEPMEFVGTEFNDRFVVELYNTSGKLLETFAQESVNDSTWYAISGVDFYDGDDTTYHTRWKTVTSNAISKYKGQTVTIRFSVYDKGDSIYDTATLIDSVVIK